MRTCTPRWSGALLVAALAVAVHARSIGFAFIGLDDRDLIVDDQAFLARPASLFEAFGRSYMHVVDPGHPYYRPLVTVSYALDALVGGSRPGGYHLTNVALHAVATALVWALLRRLGFPSAVRTGAAAVFAVHPALVPAVAWIPGRNDSLLAVFALGAWLFFARACAAPSRLDPGLHVACFGLALLSKETAVVVPLVCAAHLALAEPDPRAALGRLRPAEVLAGWAVVLGARWAVGPPAPVSLGDGLRQAWLVPATVGPLVAPVDPFLLSDPADLSVLPGIVAVVAAALAARLLPGVRRRVVALGAAVFVLFLVPSLPVSSDLILGTRLYLPALGVLLVGAELVRAAASGGNAPGEGRLVGAFAAVALLAATALGLAYEGAFRQRRAFAASAVASAPHSAMAHFCLGQSLQIDGDPGRALDEYRTALSLGLRYVAHNNIAVIHMASGRWSDAERELRAEIAVDPEYAVAYRNLAVVLRHEQRFEEAEAADARARR